MLYLLHNIGLHKHAHIQLIDAGVVEVLVDFLHEGTDNSLLKRQNVVATLCNLSQCLDRGEFLVECGVYDLMVTVGNTSDKFIRKCCGTVLSICSVHAKETKDGLLARCSNCVYRKRPKNRKMKRFNHQI